MAKIDQYTSPLPERSLQTACKVLLQTFKATYTENVVYVIIAAYKCLSPLIERLNGLLKMDECYNRLGSAHQSTSNGHNQHGHGHGNNSHSSNYDDLIVDIICVLTTIIDRTYYHLKATFEKKEEVISESLKHYNEIIIESTLDLLSFIISTGTIDKLALKLEQIRTCIDENESLCKFIINSASLISVVNQLLSSKFISIKKSEDSNLDLVRSHFIQSCEQTDFVSLVPALYTFLVLSGTTEQRPTIFDGSKYGDQDSTCSRGSVENLAVTNFSPRSDQKCNDQNANANSKSSILKKNAIPTTRLPIKLAKVTVVCLQALNSCFSLNMSLEKMPSPIHMTIHLFRHIFNYLLWHLTSNDDLNTKYCSPLEDDILLELIKLIGHFCLNNKSNQDFLAKGVQPTVLEQLCALPFSFFNDKIKRKILLSSLFCICYENERNVGLIEGLEMDMRVVSEEVYGFREEVELFRFVGRKGYFEGFWKTVEAMRSGE